MTRNNQPCLNVHNKHVMHIEQSIPFCHMLEYTKPRCDINLMFHTLYHYWCTLASSWQHCLLVAVNFHSCDNQQSSCLRRVSTCLRLTIDFVNSRTVKLYDFISYHYIVTIAYIFIFNCNIVWIKWIFLELIVNPSKLHSPIYDESHTQSAKILPQPCKQSY